MRRAMLSLSVLVAMLAGAPTPAVAQGAGPVVGMIDYAGSGPPPAGALCAPVAFEMDATSLSASAGAFRFTANGSGFCETQILGGGGVDGVLDFVAVDGAVYACPEVSGSYSRMANAFELLATGDCTVNGQGAARLLIVLHGAIVPDTPYGWFAGTFTVT